MTTLDECIARGERFLAGEGDDGAKALVNLLCGAIASLDPSYKKGLARYRATVNGYLPYTDGDARRDVEILVSKMKVLRDEKAHEMAIAKLNAAAKGATIIIQDVGNASSNSTATANATVTISQAIEAVDADPALSDEQKAELQNLLIQAKGAVAKGDKGLFARIGSKIMEGVEKAAPELIVKVLGFLVSQAAGL
ncbi:hypothetical protein H6A08_08785 [Enorma massiliensis]|uniref:hypothetical protein n=1 Tax=Enorma massiliensis TaxID=1472761 RepID=UPI00195E6620|nr:hypothetical protein [Enorma massiliensis]MBM6784445.1 hypothetical protein [Enorma massiliensis]